MVELGGFKLTGEEWVGGVSEEDKTTLEPGGDALHVEEAPHLEGVGVGYLEKGSYGRPKPLIGFKERLLART